MGVFHTIALKIEGQIKPAELGEEVERQLRAICVRHDLKILEDECGFCSPGFEKK